MRRTSRLLHVELVEHEERRKLTKLRAANRAANASALTLALLNGLEFLGHVTRLDGSCGGGGGGGSRHDER